MNNPKGIKAFYMRLNEDGRKVAAMDVLAPGIGEIIGGGQREERLTVLDQRMAERGIDQEQYAWYRDLRRYGTVPHAALASALSAPSPTSPASPTCATRSPSRAPPATRGIERDS
jgi:tRNA synthetases class II (D, K and N)